MLSYFSKFIFLWKLDLIYSQKMAKRSNKVYLRTFVILPGQPAKNITICLPISQQVILPSLANLGPNITSPLITFPVPLHGVLIPVEQRGGAAQVCCHLGLFDFGSRILTWWLWIQNGSVTTFHVFCYNSQHLHS